MAFVAMVAYAIASSGLAYLIKPIFDNVLPNQSQLGLVAGAVVVVYFVEGSGRTSRRT